MNSNSITITNGTFQPPAPEEGPNQPLMAWEDALMWIGGYLSALKGKKLTSEHIKEILKKFAEADPNNFRRLPDMSGYLQFDPNAFPQVYPQYAPTVLPNRLGSTFTITAGNDLGNAVLCNNDIPKLNAREIGASFNRTAADERRDQFLKQLQDTLNK